MTFSHIKYLELARLIVSWPWVTEVPGVLMVVVTGDPRWSEFTWPYGLFPGWVHKLKILPPKLLASY
jgi:hypothetical protein